MTLVISNKKLFQYLSKIDGWANGISNDDIKTILTGDIKTAILLLSKYGIPIKLSDYEGYN